MITEKSSVALRLSGTGQVTIDWGDGSPLETITSIYNEQFPSHTMASAGPKVIRVEGENIRTLICNDNSLISLDVSKNPALTLLYCNNNNLTNLDVSKNPALDTLFCVNNSFTILDISKNPALDNLLCAGNNLDEAALNVLFGMLPNRVGLSAGHITCWNNPGYTAAETAIKPIATAKNWILE